MDDQDLGGMLSETPQDEMWLVSYADLLTLLVGFFVLIIAGSGVKASTFEKMTASLSGQEEAPLEALKTRVEEMIERSNLGDRVRTREDGDGLGIEFKDALLFHSGSADIRKEGLPVIEQVAKLLRELPGRPVAIEGHTDDVPIRTAMFGSNWELSSKRAINVLSALESGGVERGRMSARAYADTRGLPGSGDVEAMRSANRRVVIRVE